MEANQSSCLYMRSSWELGVQKKSKEDLLGRTDKKSRSVVPNRMGKVEITEMKKKKERPQAMFSSRSKNAQLGAPLLTHFPRCHPASAAQGRPGPAERVRPTAPASPSTATWEAILSSLALRRV